MVRWLHTDGTTFGYLLMIATKIGRLCAHSLKYVARMKYHAMIVKFNLVLNSSCVALVGD